MELALVVSLLVFIGYALLLWRGASPGYPHEIPGAREATANGEVVSALGGRIQFNDVKRQSQEFIGYYHTIHLTPDQQAVKAAALKERPAACCHRSSALTCCCKCNLSKSVWGLTNYAIAKHHAGAEEIHAVIDGWLTFINPEGFDGKTCNRNGCALPATEKGCGGMSEDELVL